jgi:DNA mismatch repair protein MutL
MSFERHATSKIQTIEDLFTYVNGFRGEALASIAAVAQVELKTKRPEDETGTYLEIENSLVKSKSPLPSKWNQHRHEELILQFPARRNFLKSNAAEMRTLLMSLPGWHSFHKCFSFIANGQQVFILRRLAKQRILQLGNTYNTKLVPVKKKQIT